MRVVSLSDDHQGETVSKFPRRFLPPKHRQVFLFLGEGRVPGAAVVQGRLGLSEQNTTALSVCGFDVFHRPEEPRAEVSVQYTHLFADGAVGGESSFFPLLI